MARWSSRTASIRVCGPDRYCTAPACSDDDIESIGRLSGQSFLLRSAPILRFLMNAMSFFRRTFVSRVAGSLLVFLILAEAGAVHGQSIVYDIVIRNGRVLDGAGNPWILA